MGKGSDSQHEGIIKYILALSDKRTVLRSVSPSFSWKPFANRTINSRDIKKVAIPFHFISEEPAAILAILPRSPKIHVTMQSIAIVF